MRSLLLVLGLVGCAANETRHEPGPSTSTPEISASVAARLDSAAASTPAANDTFANTPDSSRRGPNPGQRIAVDVQVESVATRGDTVGITYQVKNLEVSEESLLSFLVDAPSGVVNIATPTPKQNWYASTDFRQRPMAVWDLIGRQLPPGGVTPDLSFEAVGLPGISTYWAGGKFKRSSDEDAAEAAVDDPLTNEMVHGVTLGVEPFPADKSPTALLKRLRSLTAATCKAPFLWITDPTLCNQLASDLDRAETLNSGGQPAQAKEVLSHFLALLSGTGAAIRDDGLTRPGYWLLSSNAKILKKRL